MDFFLFSLPFRLIYLVLIVFHCKDICHQYHNDISDNDNDHDEMRMNGEKKRNDKLMKKRKKGKEGKYKVDHFPIIYLNNFLSKCNECNSIC